MISAFLSLISIFPISFLAYACSQRLRARHESRVGRQITFPDFLRQLWIDEYIDVRSLRPLWFWLVFIFQVSILFILQIDVEYLVFIYLAVNGFVLSYIGTHQMSVAEKIQADRNQVSFAIATVVAMLCLFGCFTVSGSTSLPNAHWSPLTVLFIVPFQLAGMILFGEAPFVGMDKKSGWLKSARFYVWSLLCVNLFLGGGESYLFFHLKAAAIYLVFRAFGIYFPNYQQKDLLRISILYLFPVTGLIWLVTTLLYGILEVGVPNV